MALSSSSRDNCLGRVVPVPPCRTTRDTKQEKEQTGSYNGCLDFFHFHYIVSKLILENDPLLQTHF